ncbi:MULTISPECIES: sigma-70 family RNA polymerase sigma factor [unclassified Halomonas]|jgi:RNA polymerase sigma factor (sigma-70 family)|uniref:sigma-70 family RNA polymerase sigma factor n=1 Tax=unclassified Halomonas TaxID=2609666 RepID=UPI00028A0D6B|nr:MULTISPECIES: sigma-70 family RNA polymerase sigma factor [unclassified Halomonas]MCE8040064.1 sigma-70 family RNA polymerase sigma factor [Halomonas sp. MCCC 1A11062]
MASPRTAYSIESFYHDHHGWLQGWLHRRIGCPERAADFAQESFLRVLVRPPVEKLDQPRAFLTRIATRLIIDDSRRARLEQAWLEVQTAFAQEHLHAPSAEEVNEWLDLLEWVARLVQELPDKPRRAFLMSRLDGMAQGEIADELGVSISMVKKYMAQALLHCHKALHSPSSAAHCPALP